ncbi:hypothetical protein N7478_008190 [Penicillium angulare]|uniref:uncharacterized protein n=1 Tax=Penicillium angulare TaxID=116970 RepID=UPI002541D7FF|nr:uncharacterized protein N7478_008190 [Penicillium angulare]KAJ5273065.1 hypothetical protein N7478_008190 [Penicillium angulare]
MNHHDASKAFPTLAPGPPRTFAQQAMAAVGKPKKNSTACLACKAAKRKCSGAPPPCKACISAGAENECHFDPSRDLRRKVAVKRTIQELRDYKDLLDSLLSTIRGAHSDKVEKLVDLVKRNGPLRDLAQAVDCPVTRFTDSNILSAASLSLAEDADSKLEGQLIGQTEIENRRPSDLDSASSWSEHDKPISSSKLAFDPYARVTLDRLCDVPLLEVPARPWTEVTGDDDLVSHLISLYFTWDYPCAQFFDQGIFLDHMRQGVLNSEFCSPILVNSILSVASTYSDRPVVLSDNGNPFSRGQNFFAEAERLLRAEDGEPRLATVQALLIMSSVLSYQGRANMSWQTLGTAVQMARDLGLFKHLKRRNVQRRETPLSQDMESVRTITEWGIFNLDTQISMKLQREPNILQPTHGVEYAGNFDCEWIAYPRANQVVSPTRAARLPQVREAQVRLNEIMIHICDLLDEDYLREDFLSLLGVAKGPFAHLLQWLSNWPDLTQIGKEPTPQLLVLRIHALHMIINLYEALIERDDGESMALQLRQGWREHTKELTQCLHLYRVSYALGQIPSQLVGVVQSALHALVYQLDDSNEARHAFIELCHLAMSLRKRFKSIADSINIILSLAQHGTARLPVEAIAILDDSDL